MDPSALQDIDAEGSAERALAECEERYQSLFEHSPDGILVANFDGIYTEANQAACRLLGRSRDELLGLSIVDTLAPDEIPRLWQAREELARGAVQVREWTIRRKDGSDLPVEISAKFLCDGRWQAFVRDISERKHIERERARERAGTTMAEALRASEERLKLALKASPTLTLFHQDAELRYTWIHNAKAGFSSEGSLGKTDFDVLNRDEADELTRLKRGVLDTGVGAHAVVRVTEGSHRSYFELTIEPVHDDAGKITGITGVTWDVTDHRRIEDEQRLLAEFGAALMIAAPSDDALLTEIARLTLREFADWFVVDFIQDGRPQRVKVACADPAKRALAATLEGAPLDGERPDPLLEALRERRAELITDVRSAELEGAQGSENAAWLRTLGARSLIAVPLVSRGRLLGAFSFLISREGRAYGPSDLRFAEELARIAALAMDNAELYRKTERAVAARDDVMGMVAHDLRNPLNSVLLQSEILRRAGSPAESSGDSPTTSIRRSVQQMSRLIQDMLDVARLEGGRLAVERRVVPARSLLDDVKIMQREAVEAADLHIRIDAPEELPDILADRGRLFQVFGNLIGNAIKFAASGSEIVLGAKPTAEGTLFWATDTGPGIPAEHLPHLFDRFWQAKKTDRRGAGLGLSIVKGLVEAHGGRIWVESRVGEGTTFYFTVPLAPLPEADDASS